MFEFSQGKRFSHDNVMVRSPWPTSNTVIRERFLKDIEILQKIPPYTHILGFVFLLKKNWIITIFPSDITPEFDF